jgi:hypothetical protein
MRPSQGLNAGADQRLWLSPIGRCPRQHLFLFVPLLYGGPRVLTRSDRQLCKGKPFRGTPTK